MKAEAKSETVSNREKYRLMSLLRIQPNSTITGVTKSAIWILEPTATPIARSILFLLATVTAVTCSAAFPTIGRMMRPTKASEMLVLVTRWLILDTKNSAHTATSPVDARSRITAVIRDMFFFGGEVSLLSMEWLELTGIIESCGCIGGFSCWRAIWPWLRRPGRELERCRARGVKPVVGAPPEERPATGGPVGLAVENTVPESTLGIGGIAGTTSRTDKPRMLNGRLGELSGAN